MVNYTLISWLVFLGTFFFFMGLDVFINKESSYIYKLFYKRKSIYEFAHKIGPTVSTYIPTGKQIDLANKLMYAGYPFGLTAESFIGLQAITVLLSVVLGLILSTFGMPSFAILILAGLAIFFPNALLKEKAEKRQKEVRKDLPSMVGLLSTSVKAGIELSPAFELISMNIPGVLGEELRKSMREIATGSQRATALKRMSKRIGVDVLDRFIETINTAEERGGINVSNALEDFTEDMRVMRKFDMEEKANKLTTKMLLPTIVCMFIPLLILILTPAVFSLMKTM